VEVAGAAESWVWLKSSACISSSSSRAGRSRSIAASHARSSARQSSGPMSAASAPLRASPSDMTRSIIRSTTAGSGGAPVAAAVGAQGDRHRGVRPLGRRALLAVCVDAAGAQVVEELARRARRGRLGPGAADVDAGVVVGAADAGARRGCRRRRRRAR
jgi:hypothetical protein